MKLTKRGERVFAVCLLFTALSVLGAIGFGANFLRTHHTVIDQDTCRWSDEANGLMCDYHWEAN